MKTFISLIVGVQVIVAVQYSQFSGVLEWVLHEAKGVQDAAQRPDVHRMVYLTIVPSVQHLGGSVHRCCELSQLEETNATLIS